MVLLTHLGLYDSLLLNPFTHRIWLTISGDMGVYVFFVISGFLITTLLLQEKKLKGSISFKRFIARRFLRLLPPLLIFYLTIIILMLTGALESNFFSLGISAIYLYNFIPNRFYVTELGHTWSLSVEEQFYFIWPLVVKFLNRNQLLIVAGFAFTLSAVFIFVAPQIEMNFKGQMVFIVDKFKTARWFFPAIAPVMSGSTMALLMHNNLTQIKKIISNKLSLLLALALILAPFWLPFPLRNYLVLLQSPGIAIMLAHVYYNQKGIFAGFLEWPPLSYIGKMSYGIYVWQGLFLRTGPGGELWIQQFPQNLILTFVLAMFSYELMEKPIKKIRAQLH